MDNVRAKRLKLNMVVSVVLQVASFISGMIIPHILLLTFGSKVYGLTSSVSHFLSFISFGELGIGAVIQYNLYKPLYEKNWIEVSAVISSAKNFFDKLLVAIVFYVAILTICLPFRFSDDFSFLYTASLIISMSVSYLARYFLAMAYRQLIDAEALSYIRIIPQIISIIINVGATYALVSLGVSIQIIELISSLIFILQPVVIVVYTKKHFPEINTSVKYQGEPIKQKWNGLALHIANVINRNTDTLVLTLFSTLESVSIYSVYYMIVSGILIIIENTLNNFTAIFGNLIAKENYKEADNLLNDTEIGTHFFITIIFLCVARLSVPFVEVYTYGVKDAQYSQPLFAYLLAIAYALFCYRIPYHVFIKAAGHYKQTQKAAIIEAATNIVVSVILVANFGVIGVAIGTISAMGYKTIYYILYLRNNIINRSIKKSIKVFLADIVCVCVSWLLVSTFKMSDVSYAS